MLQQPSAQGDKEQLGFTLPSRTVCGGAAAGTAVADPCCKCYRDFQMTINGLSLASVEENVVRAVVYYFCYSHCACLLLPSVGITLLALVSSLGCKPLAAGSVVW